MSDPTVVIVQEEAPPDIVVIRDPVDPTIILVGGGPGGGGGGDPFAIHTGDPAGGVLNGTYPNPGFAQDMATQGELNAEAAARAAGDAGAIHDGDPAGGDLAGTYPNPTVLGLSIAETLVTDKVTNTGVTSPVYVTFASGTFTALSDEVMLDVGAGLTFADSAGAWGICSIIYGEAALAPLSKRQQAVEKAGVTREGLGAASYYTSVVGRQVKLTGLTPGTEYAWELQFGVVGGYIPIDAAENPLGIACSYTITPSITDGQIGDTIIAAIGATKLMAFRYNAQALGAVVAEPIGTKTTADPPTLCAVTPNGRYIGVTHQAANKVSIIDVNTMNHVVGSPFACPDAAAGLSGIGQGPGANGFYVVGTTTEKLYSLAFDGTWGSIVLGAGTAPTRHRVVGFGADAAVLVCCPGNGTVKQVDILSGTVEHTYNIPRPVQSGGLGGSTAWVASDSNGVVGPTLYQLDLNSYALDAGVEIDTSPGAHTYKDFHVKDFRSFSDNESGLIVGDNDAHTKQVLNVNLAGLAANMFGYAADRSLYTSWVNSGGGGANVEAKQLALSVYGAIFTNYTNAISIWPGGEVFCRHQMEGFAGEFAQVTAWGAE